MTRQISVTELLLLYQTQSPMATGRFTRLLNELILAAKIISREVNKAGLVDVLGSTGEVNVQGEQVQKLDEYANQILIQRMQRTGFLCGLASEENADVIGIPRNLPIGEYLLIFDPLDGSTNIDVNVNVGTIFSIYRRTQHSESSAELNEFLQKGSEQVAAGYFLYGTSTMMVFTTGKGVHGFTLDPTVGEFLLSHPHMRIPERGKIYSVNEGNTMYWDQPTKDIIEYFKGSNNESGGPYSGRYIGSLVADFHRSLLYGGIYIYPVDYKDPKKPRGKLRLLCEASPLTFVAEQAGGLGSDGQQNILDIQPEELHQRVPLFIGSKRDVEAAVRIYAEHSSA